MPEQAKELAYYHSNVGHGTEASITLAKMALDRAPSNMSKVHFGLGRPEKNKIMSRWRGSGLVTGSLTGLDLFHKKFDLPLTQVITQTRRITGPAI